MIEARQIRAARALLDWTRDDLAKASGVSVPALTQIEGEHRLARGSSLDKIRACLEAAGVVFTDNMGVKMKSDLLTVYEGEKGIQDFMDDLYVTALGGAKEFLISGGFEKDFYTMVPKSVVQAHTQRMSKIDDFSIRFIKPESDPTRPTSSYVEHKILPDQMIFAVPFYVYGQKLGIITWQPHVRVVVLSDAKVTESFRTQFNIFWKMARRPGPDVGGEDV
jgi:transcriptional regulator with XRE-family HTH domain